MKSKTRFTQVDEFYQAITAIIEWLKREGHIEESQKLHAAMLAGSTGSEIIGEIMLALKDMTGDYPPALRTEMKECLEFARNHRKILGL